MKPVIIIAIAFVLLIPITAFAQESGYPLKLDTSKEDQCKYPDSYCMEKYGMNNPDGYNSCLASVIASCESQPKTTVICEAFEFGKYTAIEDYDLLYNLVLNGLNEKSQEAGRIIVDNYKDTPQYESECQTLYKEFTQIGEESKMWRDLCPDSGDTPIINQHLNMHDTLNGVCRFATWIPIEESTEQTEPEVLGEVENICGTGTIEKNGICVPDYPDTKPSSKGGGCLIATATYGSELAPQVQQLRELRDNQLLQTKSGTSFINSFNDFYYSFSPIIADYERENPLFKEMVKVAITPMISSLSILNYVDMDSEIEVLGYGISLIILNIGMYVGIPAIVIMRIRK